MKPTSFLSGISQSNPHRTSVHMYLQSTAYHYNTILKAKSQINNSTPNQKICLDNLNNKRVKNQNAERMAFNRKMLKSLIDIQRNYSLYGVKDEDKQKQIANRNNCSLLVKSKQNIQPSSKRKSLNQIKTLKNPFEQKMHRLRISQQNIKLCNKLVNANPSISTKKQLRNWQQKQKFFSTFMSKSPQKQSSEELKHQFFTTFIKMRSTNKLSDFKIRVDPKSLIINNPQTIELKDHKKQSTKRINDSQRMGTISQKKNKLKCKKRKTKYSKRVYTIGQQSVNDDSINLGGSLDFSLDK